MAMSAFVSGPHSHSMSCSHLYLYNTYITNNGREDFHMLAISLFCTQQGRTPWASVYPIEKYKGLKKWRDISLYKKSNSGKLINSSDKSGSIFIPGITQSSASFIVYKKIKPVTGSVWGSSLPRTVLCPQHLEDLSFS